MQTSQQDIPLEQSRGDIVVVASHDPPDFESDSQFEELIDEFNSTDDFCSLLDECSYVEPDAGDPERCFDEGSRGPLSLSLSPLSLSLSLSCA